MKNYSPVVFGVYSPTSNSQDSIRLCIPFWFNPFCKQTDLCELKAGKTKRIPSIYILGIDLKALGKWTFNPFHMMFGEREVMVWKKPLKSIGLW